MNEDINKPMQVTYTYNEIDQLTYEFGQEKLKGLGYGSPYEIYYDYDPDGNMIEKTLYKGWSEGTIPAGYPSKGWVGTNQSEVVESGLSPISSKVTTYTYDAEDRLTGIQFPNNQTNSFYDCICGAKQMEYTDANGEVTRYFLDGDQVLYEYDGNNHIKTRYTNGPDIDEKISMTRYTPNSQKTTSNSSSTRAMYYYHYDDLGSVTAMTDSTGKVVETYDYDPFGVIIDHDRNVTKNLYTYTGRNYIPDAGMYDYRNRTYFPGLGRFGQVDPLLHQPSGVSQNIFTAPEHPYVYVNNNPINFTDPTGLVKGAPNTFAIKMLENYPKGQTDVQIYYFPYSYPTIPDNPRCCKIKFMQIVKDGLWPWRIDGNPWFPEQTPYEYGISAAGEQYAKMWDAPGGRWLGWIPIHVQSFETCAICVSGKDKGVNYWGIEWGHEIRDGKVIQVWPGSMSGYVPQSPSRTFIELTTGLY